MAAAAKVQAANSAPSQTNLVARAGNIRWHVQSDQGSNAGSRNDAVYSARYQRFRKYFIFLLLFPAIKYIVVSGR